MKQKIFTGLAVVVVLSVLFLKFFTIGAGDNTKFTPTSEGIWPVMTGITLLGDEFTLPKDFDHEINLVVIGFKRSHQDEINTWIEAFQTRGFSDMDLGFYEVPVVYEMEFTQRFFLNNAMKFGVPGEEQKRRTITVYLDRSQFLKTMNMDEDKIYALLINRQGQILWVIDGVFTDETERRLRAALKEHI